MTFSASSLLASLPHIQALRGKVLLIKYGGNAMTDPALQQAFAEDVVLLHNLGMYPVVVHGGGPQIDAALEKVGKQGQFIQGMRVTDDDTLQIVQWALLGQVQPELLGLLHAAGGKAVGLSGRDGGLITARTLQVQDAAGHTIDLGRVGEVAHIDTSLIWDLLEAGYIPVVSPICPDAQGQAHNVNADMVAGKLAAELDAEKLLLLTNIAGVLDKNQQLIAELTPSRIDALAADGTISGGMLPKLQGALDAASCGVQVVHILDGREAHSMLKLLLSDSVCGTAIRSA